MIVEICVDRSSLPTLTNQNRGVVEVFFKWFGALVVYFRYVLFVADKTFTNEKNKPKLVLQPIKECPKNLLDVHSFKRQLLAVLYSAAV